MTINNKGFIQIHEFIVKILSISPRIFFISYYIYKALRINGETKKSLGAILERNAIRYKDNLALLYEDLTLTHNQFNKTINQYANFFIERNVKPFDVVVIYMDSRPEMIYIVGGLAKIGAVASLVNPNQKGDSLSHSIEIENQKYIIVGEELTKYAKEILSNFKFKHLKIYWIGDKNESSPPVGWVNIMESIKTASQDNPFITNFVSAKDRFANIFTSGTTGMPKAAIQTHRRWLQLYYWFGKVNLNLSKNDVLYVSIPYYHSNALMVAWASAASSGAAMAVRRKFSASNFWDDIIRYKATAFIYIGEICRYLFNQPISQTDRKHLVTKIVGNGLRPEIWKPFKLRFGIKKVLEFYGSAEGNIAFTNTLNFDCTIGWSPAEYAIIEYDFTIDKPVYNEEGLCVKSKKGMKGLLISCINKKTPLSGYTNPQENKSKELHNVFKEGDRWFSTGDIVRSVGYGHLQFVDRIGDTFRWKGENVSTTEIEKIVNGFPGVDISASYGVSLPFTDGKAGMILLTTKNGSNTFNFNDFYIYLTAKLPFYAIPVFIRFKDKINSTDTFKIKKNILRLEGYNILKMEDPIYVLLPNNKMYTRMNLEIFKMINKGNYRF